jgi:hypothetical protein
MIAALFVRSDSIYKSIGNVDAWDMERDARRWPGGGPAVARRWRTHLAVLGEGFELSQILALTKSSWPYGLLSRFVRLVACWNTRPTRPYGKPPDYLRQVIATHSAAGRCRLISTGGVIAPKRQRGSTSSELILAAFLLSRTGLMNQRMSFKAGSVTGLDRTSRKRNASIPRQTLQNGLFRSPSFVVAIP